MECFAECSSLFLVYKRGSNIQCHQLNSAICIKRVKETKQNILKMKFAFAIVAFLVLESSCFVVPEQEIQVAVESNLKNLERVKRSCCEFFLIN